MQKLLQTKTLILIGLALIVLAGSLSYLVTKVPLSTIPVLREYVDLSLRLTTSGRVRLNSSFPDAVAVYYSFGWAMALVSLPLWYRWLKRDIENPSPIRPGLLSIPKERMHIGHRIALFLGAILFAALTVGAWMGLHGGDFRLLKVGTSLPTLIFFGWLVSMAFGVLPMLTWAAIKKFFTGKV
jgi:hypothetical protein